MAKATVNGSLIEGRAGKLTASLTVEGLEGWEVTVTTREGSTGQHITDLRVKAMRPDLILTGEQLRKITPADLIRAMNNPWLLSTTPGVTKQRNRLRDETDKYMVDLVRTALARQGTVSALRRALAEQFGRTEGQIRDELHRARVLGYLMPSSAGSRLLQAGPKYLELTQPAIGKRAIR